MRSYNVPPNDVFCGHFPYQTPEWEAIRKLSAAANLDIVSQKKAVSTIPVDKGNYGTDPLNPPLMDYII
jgi:hypothetical protein